ncbi:MAG: hypothetical protein J2P36_38010, partial [Ktedonobacteraceae bacterium]|nr:hypothetical protein [Ktedonobacteraceae bacterium]
MERFFIQIVTATLLATISILLLNALTIVVNSARTIAGTLNTRLGYWFKTQLFTWSGLFWLVNGVCMLFSAQNAGYLFGIYEPLTGWAVGLVLDLLIIVFTQSMLHALARGEKGRAAQILGFIFACTLISFLGNLAHNLHVPASNAFTGVWFAILLPYTASVMPFFLVALAWVSDLKGNPLETMDVRQYEALEQKQADFLRVQVEQREQRAALQAHLIVVEQMEQQNKQLRKKKLPKTFRWFWEQPADVETVIATVATQLKTMFETDLKALHQHQETLAQQGQIVKTLTSERGAFSTLQYQKWMSDGQATDETEQCQHTIEGAALKARLQEQRMEQADTPVKQVVSHALSGQQSPQNTMEFQDVKRDVFTNDEDSDDLPPLLLLPAQNGSSSATIMPLISHAKERLYRCDGGEKTMSDTHEKKAILIGKKGIDYSRLILEVRTLVMRFPGLQTWLDNGIPATVSKQDIVALTGLSIRAINRATLARTKNPNRYRIVSVIKWLKTVR